MRDAVSHAFTPHPRPLARVPWAAPAARAESAPCEPLLTARERGAVERSAWFASLPLLLRHDLLRHCTVQRYRCGDAVHADPSSLQLDAVASGAVAVSTTRTDAAPFDILAPGTWLVDPGLLMRGERARHLVAQGRTTIVTVKAAALAEAMSLHDALAPALRDLSHARVVADTRVLDEFAALELPVRVARCLVRLCASFGVAEEAGTRIAVDLKQDTLATLVRASRARVNLHLKAMERAGIIVVERRMLVLDVEALADSARC